MTNTTNFDTEVDYTPFSSTAFLVASARLHPPLKVPVSNSSVFTGVLKMMEPVDASISERMSIINALSQGTGAVNGFAERVTVSASFINAMNEVSLSLTKKEASLLITYMKDMHRHHLRLGHKAAYGNNAKVMEILNRCNLVYIGEHQTTRDSWELAFVTVSTRREVSGPLDILPKRVISVNKRRPNGTLIPATEMLQTAFLQLKN